MHDFRVLETRSPKSADMLGHNFSYGSREGLFLLHSASMAQGFLGLWQHHLTLCFGSHMSFSWALCVSASPSISLIDTVIEFSTHSDFRITTSEDSSQFMSARPISKLGHILWFQVGLSFRRILPNPLYLV